MHRANSRVTACPGPFVSAQPIFAILETRSRPAVNDVGLHPEAYPVYKTASTGIHPAQCRETDCGRTEANSGFFTKSSAVNRIPCEPLRFFVIQKEHLVISRLLRS